MPYECDGNASSLSTGKLDAAEAHSAPAGCWMGFDVKSFAGQDVILVDPRRYFMAVLSGVAGKGRPAICNAACMYCSVAVPT